MTTIDQRILIPTPPSVVWDYVQDVRNNPSWQIDCRSIQFLTSKQTGAGTRWRQTTDKGAEQVVEITAWYDGLGYQYTYVDGVPYRESIGRLRLQEIPEGTVVQLTLTYELGGLLGGVRSSLGTSRHVEAVMVQSLKALWKQVNSSGAAHDWREAKSLMRDAPDVEQRAHYKPRHPVVIDLRAESGGTPGIAQARPIAPVIEEPPIADDDTRPRPAIAARRQSIEELVEESEEPEFLDDLSRFAPPPDYMFDTQPIRPITPDQAQAASETSAPAEPLTPARDNELFRFDEPVMAIPPFSLAEPPPAEAVEDEALASDVDQLLAEASTASGERVEDMVAGEALGSSDVLPAETMQPEPIAASDGEPKPETPIARGDTRFEPLMPPHAEPTVAISRSELPPTPADISAMDTAALSIWDVFGVQRPSDTHELARALKADTVDAPDEETMELPQPVSQAKRVRDTTGSMAAVAFDVIPPDMSPPRIGLRTRMRREWVRLRRPE